MKISSILKQKRTWSIMLFYVLAVLIRVVSTRFETIDPSHVKLWDFVGGLSPLIGAIVVILALRRKMKTSLFGTSVTKSILTLAVPFVLFGIVDYKEIGLCLWLLFVYLLYAFFEEVGWRGYLYSELIGCKIIHRLLLTTLLWLFWHCRAWQIGDVGFFALLFLASSVIRILLYWWPASMVCSIFISNASPTQAIGRQSFVSSSPSCCGSTFGMGQKSRFAGDNVMLGTKIQKERKKYWRTPRCSH